MYVFIVSYKYVLFARIEFSCCKQIQSKTVYYKFYFTKKHFKISPAEELNEMEKYRFIICFDSEFIPGQHLESIPVSQLEQNKKYKILCLIIFERTRTHAGEINISIKLDGGFQLELSNRFKMFSEYIKQKTPIPQNVFLSYVGRGLRNEYIINFYDEDQLIEFDSDYKTKQFDFTHYFERIDVYKLELNIKYKILWLHTFESKGKTNAGKINILIKLHGGFEVMIPHRFNMFAEFIKLKKPENVFLSYEGRGSRNEYIIHFYDEDKLIELNSNNI